MFISPPVFKLNEAIQRITEFNQNSRREKNFGKGFLNRHSCESRNPGRKLSSKEG